VVRDTVSGDPQQSAYVDLHFRAFQEDNQWVSECVELGVASCGDSMQEALAAIVDATTLYLETLEDEGELEGVLRDAGLRRTVHGEAEPEASIAMRLPVPSGTV
jgi:predicted RNase H-like HicB family nuclease